MSEIKSAFVAYRHTGEDPAVLEQMLTGVVASLGEVGVEGYCTFFAESDFKAKSMNARDVMEHAFDEIEERDALIVVQASNEKSEGMLMEVGRFFRVKPIIVATHIEVQNTYLPQMADVAFRWGDLDELFSGISSSVKQLK